MTKMTKKQITDEIIKYVALLETSWLKNVNDFRAMYERERD